MRSVRRRLAVVPLLLFLANGSARAEGVALTFDDLPTLALTDSFSYANTTTVRLLDGLRRNRIPATGFVNEIKLEGQDKPARIALLNEWLDAGMDLGNHGYSHLSLNKTPLPAYIFDVERGATITSALLAARGRSERWFRYPYLETGLTPEIRRDFERWLASHRYRVAPVTLENSDWMFALPYDNAVLGDDAAGASRLRRAYLDYTEKVVGWYRKAALALLGRRPALVFLLHATRLNADSIDQLNRILRANALRPVTLDEAMNDTAYLTPDTYVGPDGDEWLSRWSATLHRDLPWDSFVGPPKDIETENSRLDTSP